MKYLILLSLFFCIQVFAKKPNLSDLPAVGVGGYGGAVVTNKGLPGGGYPATGNERDIRKEQLQRKYDIDQAYFLGRLDTVTNNLKSLKKANIKRYRMGKNLFQYSMKNPFSNKEIAKRDFKILEKRYRSLKKKIGTIEKILTQGLVN